MGERARILCLIMVAALLFLPPCGQRAQASEPPLVQGRVLDASTGLPLANATVDVWNTGGAAGSAWSRVAAVKTDVEGRYTATLSGEFRGRVYAYLDDSDTPGFDYVPAFNDLYFSGEMDLTFRLIPAASIMMKGEIRFVDVKEASKTISFTVIDPETGSPPETGNVYSYGTIQSRPLELDPRHVIVPAETLVNIRVNATVLGAQGREVRSFIAGGDEPFKVGRGQILRVDVQPYLFRFNLDVTENLLSLATATLEDLEGKGFYVTVERRDLAKVRSLVGKAEGEDTEGAYGESRADLREAYLGVTAANQRLQGIFAEAASSSLLLTVFLAFMALAVALLVFNPWPLKAAAGAALYAAFLTVLYYVYPGSRLVEPGSLLQNAAISFGSALALSLLASRFLKDEVIYIFSMAKRNVKRRRLRFALTLIPVTVLAMSFVVLTSFSTGYGLTVSSRLSLSPHPDGLMVRQPLPPPRPEAITFYALDVSAVQWLREQSEALTVAPKAESFPIAALFGLGTLSPSDNPETTVPFSGILGVQPSVEAEVTQLNDSLVLVEGRSLQDGDGGILVSASAAESLGVKAGERLLMRRGRSEIEVELAGVFDDESLRRIRDIDSQPMIPQKAVMITGEGGSLIVLNPCEPSEVVVMDWQTALKFDSVALSRIDVRTRDAESILPLARRIALERSLWVWSSVGGRVYVTSLAEYVEAKGLSIAIPWSIVIMSVIVTMLNAIFERRREVAILSSVGLNPSHIQGLFIAESAVIGVIGGGAGYLLGLGSYRAMSALSLTVEVRQKVSALWSLGTLGVAVTAVVVGAFIALRYSVVITPSFLRRWMEGERGEDFREPLDLLIPINPREEALDSLLNYLKRRVQGHFQGAFGLGAEEVSKNIKEAEEETSGTRTKLIRFDYLFGQGSVPFELVAERKRGEAVYSLRLRCRAGGIYDVATLVRMAALEWSSGKG